MNGRGLRQVMAVMRQSGAGYILTLAALGVFEWWSLGQRPYQQSRFSPHIWNSLLVVSATPPVLLCWIIIGQYHARLLISGSRLRMPGMLRVVCISLLGAALWFAEDAEDARRWLEQHGLIDAAARVTHTLRP